MPPTSRPPRPTLHHRLSHRLRRAIAAAATTAVVALGSCGGQHHDLRVTTFSPVKVGERGGPIEVRFDKPVVTDAVVGAEVTTGVALEPRVAWRGHWQDRQTLIVEPTEPLAPSTRYQVVLTDELARRTGGFRFEFVHQPLAIEGLIDDGAAEALPVDAPFRLGFAQKVRAGDVAAHCHVTGAAGKTALTVTTPDEVATAIAVRPAKALPADADLTVACEGLAAAGGDAPMPEPWSAPVHTRSNLFVRAITPAGSDVAADEVTIEIALSTPVALEEIRKAVTASPAIPGLDAGWLDGGGTRYRVTADLETNTAYTITVANLKDTYGQRLPAEATHDFGTGDASPRMSLERGIYALEASATGYPVWTRNVSAYQVECAAIPTGKLVQALTTDMNYDPWGGSDDSAPIGWKALGVTAVKKAMRVEGAKNKWHLDNLDLGATCGARTGARGVFLADLTSGEIKPDPDAPWRTPTTNRILANVTDLGVLIKSGPSSGLVWVTSLATGAPVAGAKVTLYTPQGKAVHSGTTDAGGVLHTPGSAKLLAQPEADRTAVEDEGEGWEDWDAYRSQRLLAIVEKGGDTAVVDGNWANGIQIWNFGVEQDRSGGTTKLRGFIQSDRGLYRPGEQVHLKGLVREVTAGRTPRVPVTASTTPVTVDVTDSRGATVTTQEVALSKFGGWSFDLPLGEEAALGDYYVRATVAGQVFRERFSVEEFRPAGFEVKVTAAEKLVRPGDRLTATVDAQYLFGAPVVKGKIAWSVSRREHTLRFPGYEQYSFDASQRWWWYDDNDYDYGDLISDGEAETDARGRFEIGLHDPEPDASGPRDYVINAAVTDEADQTIGRSTVVTAHATDVYLGLHTQEYVQAVGMPFAVNVVAMTPAGARVGHAATLRFVREVADCSYDQFGFRSYARCTSHDEVALERAITVPATGAATERIFPKDPGDYKVVVETTDSRGTKVVASSGVWVIGKGEAFWSGDESARMTLVANKQRYQAGDKVRLAAQTGLKAPTALVTIERDGIVSSEVKQLASASEGIELTADASWAPNVFASVVMVQGRKGPGDRDRPQMKMGVVELAVSAEHRRLAIAIATDQASYQPGQPVTGTVTVTHDGKPVAAEVALSVADEGVLQLIDYRTPDPMKTFYATFGLGVDAGTNWNRIARLADPGAGDPDEGGDGGSEGGDRIRSKFVSSAFWAPALVTDARGQASFTFAAPDNLTAFRLMAAGADIGDRFGAGELRITVSKPVLAQPVLPRFFTVGDAASVGVIVHNRTDVAGEATVTARATGLTLASASSTVNVPARGSTRVRFGARVDDAAAAQLEFAVALGAHRDTVRLDLPVARPRVRTARLVARGQLTDAAATIAVATPPGAIAGESELTITIDRTGLGDLEPSLRYLVEYPYGCLEQTMSRFLPLAKAKDLAASMNLASLQGTRADQFLAAGVAKVARHQQGDGHFSLWPQSETYPHLTALALFGLAEAGKAGVAVPADTVARGRAALARWIESSEAWNRPGDTAVIAMAAYLLAAGGKPDHGVHARLYDRRAALPPWGLAFLARALHAAPTAAGKKQLAEIVKLLRASARGTGDTAMVADAHDDVSSELMSSDVRSSAMVLAALLEVAPKDPLVERLVRGLDAARASDGRWTSTQDNVWTLTALADYARRAGAGRADVKVTSGSRTLGGATIENGGVIVVRARPSDLTGGALAITGTAGVHYRVRAVDVAKDAGAAVEAGFTIERQYLDASGAALVSFKAGQLVTVRLTISTPVERRWIALVDPIPGGFEAVNPRLAVNVGANQGQHAWVWAHQELRDDAARWFADYVWRGSYSMSYQVRATIDGTFAAGPATIEAMYEPSIMARTAAATITVAP